MKSKYTLNFIFICSGLILTDFSYAAITPYNYTAPCCNEYNLTNSDEYEMAQLPFVNLKLKPALIYSMLSNTTSFDNDLNILYAKKNLEQRTFYIGGYTQGGLNYVRADETTFFYSVNETYKTKKILSLDRIAIALIGSLNSWSTIYLEAGGTDVGQNYSSDLGINQFYFLASDGIFPLYAFFGYKNIDFGNFSTVNIFAQSITRWDYAGTALTAGGGYASNGFNTTVSILKSGSEGLEDYYGAGLWRVHIFPNYYQAHGTNFAVNTSYGGCLSKDLNLNVGAGYIRGLWLGSPINSFNKSNIGAWDINTQLNYKQMNFLAEYIQSIPRTTSFGSFATSDTNGVYLQTWDLGMSYKFKDFILPHESSINADVSGVIGNTSFANATQAVLGLNNNFIQNVKGGLEYVFISQTSGQDANRSGLFFRTHEKVQILRLDLTANF